jgi:hypothetical protein
VQDVLVCDLEIGAAWWEGFAQEGRHVREALRCKCGIAGSVEDFGEPAIVLSLLAFGV